MYVKPDGIMLLLEENPSIVIFAIVPPPSCGSFQFKIRFPDSTENVRSETGPGGPTE